MIFLAVLICILDTHVCMLLCAFCLFVSDLTSLNFWGLSVCMHILLVVWYVCSTIGLHQQIKDYIFDMSRYSSTNSR